MPQIEDTDLMLVERGGVSYKATGLDIKNSLGRDGQVRKIASGSIGLGDPVALNDDGTVRTVSTTSGLTALETTATASLDILSSYPAAICYIGNNKYLIASRTNTQIYLRVATLNPDNTLSIPSTFQATTGGLQSSGQGSYSSVYCTFRSSCYVLL